MNLRRTIPLVMLLMVSLGAFSQAQVKGVTTFTGTSFLDLLLEVEGLPNQPIVVKGVISSNTNGVLWQGNIPGKKFERDGKQYVEALLKNLSPALWTPLQPNLYTFFIELYANDSVIASAQERIGFRSFESKDGQLFLNGSPIFLRGIAINPPGRGIPSDLEKSRKFALEYVQFMKNMNVNIIRIPDNEDWYDVCDELGMMVFGGNYSGSVANGGYMKAPKPEDYESSISWYRTKKFNKIAHHPSLMVYAITNETPYRGDNFKPWQDFTKYVFKRLQKEWDSTRLYIGNAGYGYGQSGDICDLHRYWGWYYSSPFTFLNTRNNKNIVPFDKPVQPITFTECVGNYTGPDGRYNLSPNHKNPVSQLCWTGHAATKMQAKLASDHQVFTIKQVLELNRRLRVHNKELSGVFPFTILFKNWHTVGSFSEMEPKKAAFQAKISYAPVLLSWELWTQNVYAGQNFPIRYHIVNDADDFMDVTDTQLVYKVIDESGKVYDSGEVVLPTVPYYGTQSGQLTLSLPTVMQSGNYKVVGELQKGDKVIGSNSTKLYVGNKRNINPSRDIFVLDRDTKIINALDALKITDYQIVSRPKELTESGLLVLGRDGILAKDTQKSIKKFVSKGGRVLITGELEGLYPKISELCGIAIKEGSMDIDDGTYPPPLRPSKNGFNINPERPDHPLYRGIQREDLKIFSDYTAWDESKPGFPKIYPVENGFSFDKVASFENIAVLGNYSVGLEAIAVAEVFQGNGSYMINAFQLLKRIDKDPLADRLLQNSIAYMANDKEHDAHPLVEGTISWGQYETEKGLLTGINSGFMLNSKPLLTGSYKDKPLVLKPEGHMYAERYGGWNTNPGLQYVPYGRRAFGPYFHRGFGGVPEAYDYGSLGRAEFYCAVEKNVKQMKTLVWNPADENLTVHCTINGSRVEKSVQPDQKIWITNPFKSKDMNKVVLEADRRIVFLETEFN